MTKPPVANIYPLSRTGMGWVGAMGQCVLVGRQALDRFYLEETNPPVIWAPRGFLRWMRDAGYPTEEVMWNSTMLCDEIDRFMAKDDIPF